MTKHAPKPATTDINSHRPQLLTPAEVAERFHTTVASLAQMRYEDRGPAHVKFGRSVLYVEDDIYEWVMRTRTVPSHK